ncbi:unnamed protein product [Lactuca saligna]|uniref:Uncharacterized protein n=1 Tax=Lactuca saligna TaxID=75948 RepID=A0AA36A044_LACSI|nr:unnamed protein product [Lactuca saligna]
MDHNNNDNTEMWDWEDEDYGLQTIASNSLWSNANENEDDLTYVFNETTPAKSFEDLAYQVTNNENINKGKEPYREAYSQAKRRRMLQFDNEIVDVDMIPVCGKDFSSTYLKSKEREASLNGALSDINQWVDGFTDDIPASGSGYEGWLHDCLVDDTEMHLSTNDLNPSVQIELTESKNSQSKNDEEIPTPTRKNIILKGKKSFIKTRTTKIASSVVLPFAFVKPCGMQGAVTLKDINQKILTPPPSKSKKSHESENENPEKSYPTSAFSRKPVVGKTKIRTEGGKELLVKKKKRQRAKVKGVDGWVVFVS